MPYFARRVDRHRAVAAVLRRPARDAVAATLRRRDAGALLPVDPAVTRPVARGDLRRHLRDLPAVRARRSRRVRADRPLGGRAHRCQADEGRLPAPLRADPPVEGPVSRHPARLPEPAVPVVHRFDVAAGRQVVPPERELLGAPTPLLLVGVPVLHHHRGERVRRRVAGPHHVVAVPAGHLPAEHDLAPRRHPAVVLRAARR